MVSTIDINREGSKTITFLCAPASIVPLRLILGRDFNICKFEDYGFSTLIFALK